MTPLLLLLSRALADPSAAGAHARPSTPPELLPAWAAPTSVPSPPVRAPRAWRDLPVAWPPHPVGYHYGRRYQELLAALVGGPGASPVFGPVVAEADVHWRLLGATGVGLDLAPEEAERWRDTALAGSLFAMERLADETLERAPTLYGVYIAGDTLLSPSFDVRAANADRTEVELVHRAGGVAARRLERAEAELAMGRLGKPRGRPAPSMGAGLDWELRSDDQPETAPLVQYTGWLSATEIGLTSVRLEVAPGPLAWTVSARQILAPRLFAIGTARSEPTTPTLGRVSGGLMWTPPLPGSCNVRAERILAYEDADERWMLTLRCENRTSIPAPLDPPLGDRGLDGLALPWAPDTGRNTLRRWAPTSASEAPR